MTVQTRLRKATPGGLFSQGRSVCSGGAIEALSFFAYRRKSRKALFFCPWVGKAGALQPSLFHEGHGGPLFLGSGRGAKWLQPYIFHFESRGLSFFAIGQASASLLLNGGRA